MSKISRVYRRSVVASRAFKVGVAGKFVSEFAGRISFSPRSQSNFVQIFNRRGKFCVKIRFYFLWRDFVASGAIRRAGNFRVQLFDGQRHFRGRC